MIRDQFLLGLDNEIIVDLFAGGGGMSCAIEQALGRHVDIAINHDAEAISMHMANHPQTQHYCADVFEVCPHEATQGRPVGHLHGSPDCTHFSQAVGGQPRSKQIRSLGWVMIRWAGQVLPRSISMENVRQMLQWGPLIAKRDKQTRRVIKLDGTVAAPGERVPVQEQFLVPDPARIGKTWRRFVAELQRLGYQVEWRTLIAANFGAATTRERLFLFARRDNKPIVWPSQTHYATPDKGRKSWQAAARHIDFSDLGNSIFDRPKPLAEATMRRIAKGVKKFALDNPQPFVVELANWSSKNGVAGVNEPLRTITAWPKGGAFAVAQPSLVPLTHQGADRVYDSTQPIRTITAAHRGEIALAAPVLTPYYGGHQGNRACDASEPLRTQTTENRHALVSACLIQANGGFNQTVGRALDEPATTITTTGSQQQLVTCDLERDSEDKALRVAAFLVSYYGTDNMSSPADPLPTVTTRDRLALVTVWIKGEPWLIVDIKLRMLKPAELYGCQGFPAGYIFDRGHDGRAFSKSAQVRMVGNSVSPPPAMALIRANCMDLAAWTHRELKQRERAAA